jgi:drug/metabolite transporter (DMT)-like permease
MKLKAWTIGRATGLGVMAGLLALVLWPVYASVQERVLVPFIAVLLVTAFCGLSILGISLVDAVRNQRGGSVRPLRIFDVAVGLLLAGPSLLQLDALLG